MMQFLSNAAPCHQIDPIFGSHRPTNRYLNSRSMSPSSKYIHEIFPLSCGQSNLLMIIKKRETHRHPNRAPSQTHDFDQCRCTKLFIKNKKKTKTKNEFDLIYMTYPFKQFIIIRPIK